MVKIKFTEAGTKSFTEEQENVNMTWRQRNLQTLQVKTKGENFKVPA